MKQRSLANNVLSHTLSLKLLSLKWKLQETTSDKYMLLVLYD